MINWRCISVVERMLHMYEVLGSIPSISKHRLMFNDFYANLRKSISLLPCKVPTDGFIVFVKLHKQQSLLQYGDVAQW